MQLAIAVNNILVYIVLGLFVASKPTWSPSNINISDLRAWFAPVSTLRSCCQESNVGIRFTVKGERKKRREGKRENWVIAIKVVYVRCAASRSF